MPYPFHQDPTPNPENDPRDDVVAHAFIEALRSESASKPCNCDQARLAERRAEVYRCALTAIRSTLKGRADLELVVNQIGTLLCLAEAGVERLNREAGTVLTVCPGYLAHGSSKVPCERCGLKLEDHP